MSLSITSKSLLGVAIKRLGMSVYKKLFVVSLYNYVHYARKQKKTRPRPLIMLNLEILNEKTQTTTVTIKSEQCYEYFTVMKYQMCQMINVAK